VSVISGLSRGFSTCCLRFKNGVATTHAKLADEEAKALFAEALKRDPTASPRVEGIYRLLDEGKNDESCPQEGLEGKEVYYTAFSAEMKKSAAVACLRPEPADAQP
jgi:hypothetical protein